MPPTLPGGEDTPNECREAEGQHNYLPDAQLNWPDPEEDDEDIMYGYEMLSANEEDFRETDASEDESEEDNQQPSHSQMPMDAEAISPPTSSDILHSRLHLGPDDIEKIMSIMKNITLPSNNIPSWTSVVPEEEWKSVLVEKISASTSKEQRSLSSSDEREQAGSSKSDEKI